MHEDDVLYHATSAFGNLIRVTYHQWAHVSESHDYMSGNIDKVLETIAEPDQIVEVETGESIALRKYEKTNITSKTAVVIYRDELNGFMLTAFFTSKPAKILKKGRLKWSQSLEN